MVQQKKFSQFHPSVRFAVIRALLPNFGPKPSKFSNSDTDSNLSSSMYVQGLYDLLRIALVLTRI